MVHAELAGITTTTAKASVAADGEIHICTSQIELIQPSLTEKAIKEIIQQLPNGFETLDSIVREKLAALIVGTLADQEGMTEEEALREDNSTQQDQIATLQEENVSQQDQIHEQQDQIATMQEENVSQQDQIHEQQHQIEALMLQNEILSKRSTASNWRCC